ncbi:RHS repeat domain-containing protein [Methylosinus sp. C49]|uniref:RHS repeat domain-containing protein n=1 Tax=Methylosinus sp. C49 TaxID=2699395 RepID=UPI0013794A90|nr:RHS repeat domain-containing protein [Methylosinus sp. C49]
MTTYSQLPVVDLATRPRTTAERVPIGRRSRAAFRQWSLAVAILAGGANSAEAANSYSYDRLGRLTSAIYDNGLCVAYSYDANGNRTAISSSPTPPGIPVWGAGTFGCIHWTAP